MHNGTQEMDESRQLAWDAVDWYVRNESDREPDQEFVKQWELWCNDVRNLEKYEDVIRMRQQLLMVAAPTPASQASLVADFEREKPAG